ncbi:isocitrate dehydrogenase [NAD] subunit gamma, mitochondrial isoform X2 [Latimeria chalumnae]|uniref:isocitrate dehydrogenase [NAD] subunit gamma, mitochondrial isoform X2 n=1 Tax=Latimeria chalumnae TaxID=7897 RepID=UPI00313F04E0
MVASFSSVLAASRVFRPAALHNGLGNSFRLLGVHPAYQRSTASYTTSQPIPLPAKYGGRHTVTMIPGDGIGPELMLHVKEVFRSACVPVDFEEVNVNSSKPSEDDIHNAITAIRRNRVALKGNIETNHTLPASHKSRNSLLRKLGDGLFLQCCREVAAGYPDISFENMIVDNTTMQLVSRPQQFDVMVMPNLYGNVVNNVCAGLVGGPGLVPGANYGTAYAIFETATRNTGKSIANKNIANPTAMLLASCMMLDYLGLHDSAALVRKAILRTMNEHRMHTPDIGGQGTTSEVVQSIIRQIYEPSTKQMDAM